jgi:hypothetical protein
LVIGQQQPCEGQISTKEFDGQSGASIRFDGRSHGLVEVAFRIGDRKPVDVFGRPLQKAMDLNRVPTGQRKTKSRRRGQSDLRGKLVQLIHALGDLCQRREPLFPRSARPSWQPQLRPHPSQYCGVQIAIHLCDVQRLADHRFIQQAKLPLIAKVVGAQP